MHMGVYKDGEDAMSAIAIHKSKKLTGAHLALVLVSIGSKGSDGRAAVIDGISAKVYAVGSLPGCMSAMTDGKVFVSTKVDLG